MKKLVALIAAFVKTASHDTRYLLTTNGMLVGTDVSPYAEYRL